MMQQWHQIRAGLSDDTLLLFRLGDFYEIFLQDAERGATLLGITPGALVFTSVGAGLGAVFAAGETPDLGIIFEPQVLLPLLGLAALSALPLLIKAVKGRKGLA